MLCSMWDLSSWARDQTLTSCLRSVSLTLQARPTFSFCWWFPLLCSVLILCLHVIMHAWVKAIVPGDSTRMPIAYVQCEPLYWSAWDTITKHQRLGSLNSTTLFFSRCWSPEVQDQGAGRDGFLWNLFDLQRPPSSASSPGHSLCGMALLVSLCRTPPVRLD